MKQHYTIFLVSLLFCAIANAQTTYYVNASQTDNSGNGLSWATAKRDLQNAIDLTVENDEIRVAQGIYYPTESPDGTNTDIRDSAFHIDKDITIKGGYDPDTGIQDIRQKSVLSGDIGILDDDSDNAYHVLVVVGTTMGALIEGFVLQDGNANGNGNISFASYNFVRRSYGGGLFMANASPTLNQLLIEDNIASDANATIGGSGAGIYATNTSFILTNSVLSENVSSTQGGGLWISSATPELTNVVFYQNDAERGGGMYNFEFEDAALTNVIFYGNNATDEGGGLYINSSSPILYNTVFFENTATNSGNNISGFNSATINTNSSHNASDIDEGGINVNTFFILNGDPFLSSSDPDGLDNVFGTADDGLRPDLASALINAGDNSRNSEPNDIAGETRIQNSTIEIGAYEVDASSLSITNSNANKVQFYPNPAGDVLFIDVQAADINDSKVYDMQGRLIQNLKSESNSNPFKFDVSRLATGHYILKLQTDKGVTSLKFVKE